VSHVPPLEPPLREAPCEEFEADVCVVGGGMAGCCAAISAARHGVPTLLIQDRPVFGGNASSEVRMWICGAHGPDFRETGILHELQLENLYRNPHLNYPLWDTVLFGKVHEQEHLTAILNCAVCEVAMEDGCIAAVRAWHLTRQRWLRIAARHFVDCSGDSILRLSGAPVRWGREARAEFDEPAAPEEADRKTMGNSLLIQLREIDPADHEPFVPPGWAHAYDDSHPRLAGMKPTGHNFWWLEIGGEDDTIADADAIRDELYRIAFGAWAYIKNHPDGRGRAWELEWIGALPGKRENVRYEGDHVLIQQEVEAHGKFEDVVAHGGWTMDDHPPAAFAHPGPPTVHHPAPSPYGIPYRCLYSRAVPNLFCAGRNISASHMALSSTRVMATCATLGQAAGTAAAIAQRRGCDARGVGTEHRTELQQRLMDDDQWIPGRRRTIPPLAREGTISTSDGDGEPLRDGVDRRLDGDDHAWCGGPTAWVEYRWDAPREVTRARIVGDSMLHRAKRQPCNWPLRGYDARVPAPMPRTFHLEAEVDGAWCTVAEVHDNRRRLVVIPLAVTATAIRLMIDATWGAAEARLFAFDVGEPDLAAEPEAMAWPEPVWTGRGQA